MGSNVDSDHSLMIEENESSSMKIDAESSRFPCCIVWSPLPVLSWFIPFIGHIGICRENGVILDFAAPNFVSVDNFAFGSPTRYIQLTKHQCCIFLNSNTRDHEDGSKENEPTWDGALLGSTQEYQHRSYNLFTCNCHSFVSNCLNRLKFEKGGWNVVNLAVLIFVKGRWVSKAAMVKTYLPFAIVFSIGVAFGGWTFFSYLAIFIFVLVGWFVIGTYSFKKLIHL